MIGHISRRGLVAGAASAAAATTALATAPNLADSPDGIVLGPGTHYVTLSTTIKSDLTLLPGARIEVAAGRVLTLKGGFSAPVAGVFTGPGRVDLNASRCHAAYPEWWGAVTDDPAADCLPSLQACIAAHPCIVLRAADYHTADTFIVNRPHVRIWGSGYRGVTPGQGTRIIVRSGTADVVRVGPSAKPPQVNDFLQGVDLRWIDLTRSRPLDAPSSAPPPAGLLAQFLLFCQFEAVGSRENGAGFIARGLVRSAFRDCIAFRSFDGARSGAPFRGFILDGDGDIGLAGGNASLSLDNCNVAVGGTPNIADSVGLLMTGGFADTRIASLETTQVATGIRVTGNTAVLGPRAAVAHANLHIHAPVIDQCVIGIEITDTAEQALIDLTAPYIGLAPAAEAAIRLNRMRGAFTLSGGQVLGGMNAQADGNAIGLHVANSSGLSVAGLKLLDLRRPVALENCRQVSLQAWIGNPGEKPTAAAATLTRCDRIGAALQISGRPGAFAQGIAIDPGTTDVAIDSTGIDQRAIAGSRIVIGSRPLPIPGRLSSISAT